MREFASSMSAVARTQQYEQSDEHIREDTNEKIKDLKDAAYCLWKEVQALPFAQALDLRHGIDFYDEVRAFEINLIQRALQETGGHQTRAAQLLGLNLTTLNSKIKQFNIPISELQDEQ